MFMNKQSAILGCDLGEIETNRCIRAHLLEREDR